MGILRGSPEMSVIEVGPRYGHSTENFSCPDDTTPEEQKIIDEANDPAVNQITVRTDVIFRGVDEDWDHRRNPYSS